MATIRLFHGTAHVFDGFDNRFAMRGTEPNSALGIHLTESPFLAAEYAELSARDRHATDPTVLVLDVEIDRALCISSVEDFLGRPHDYPLDLADPALRKHSDFIEARLVLQEAGFDAVALDSPIDDLIGTWVVFDPNRITIVDRLKANDVLMSDDMDEECDFSAVELESGSLFAANHAVRL